jgi:undecaprenyl-diphosphatase
MTIFYVFLSSIVEGLTEFLPISSTGHLIILNHVFGIKSTPLISSFDIFIQLGAILAIVNLYYKELLADKKQLLNLLISFLPTAIVGLIFYPLIKNYLLGNITITATALLIGGIFIFFLPKNIIPKKKLSFLDYFKIGLFQSLSIIPGASRALMTIIGGIYSGLSLIESIKYSFLLAIPTIGAATALDLFKNRKIVFSDPQSIKFFLLGFLISFLTAKVTVNFFLNFSKKNGLRFFGFYRIALSLILLIFFILPL